MTMNNALSGSIIEQRCKQEKMSRFERRVRNENVDDGEKR